MRLDIEADGFDSAADALVDANHDVASAYTTLRVALGGFGGFGGDDTTSEDFVAGYDGGAAGACEALRDLVTAFGTLATLTADSGANHRDADASSVVRGSGPSAPRPELDLVGGYWYTPPTALGADDSGMPEWWDLVVDHLQGWAWPSADVDRLDDGAAAWTAMAQVLDRMPSHCTVATTLLQQQDSPEIGLATQAVAEVSGACEDLAESCRALAEACSGYAEAVRTTRETVLGLLRDLAIEIGVTAGISAVASFFTFGGAAVVGAGVAVARAVSCARRIIAALMAIRAIRVVVRVAHVVDEMTDVVAVLRRFRSLRRVRRTPDVPTPRTPDAPTTPPTGRLPERGTPGSYGYDEDGVRLPYANSRPGYGPGQVDEVWENAQDANGEVWVNGADGVPYRVDWEPGQPRQGVWDMGHVPEAQYRDLRDQYLNGDITKEQFLREYRDPDNYRVEDPSRNRSHVDEGG